MISPSGIITTIAGTGIAGFNGDGIAPTSANLKYPRGVAVSTDGGHNVVYIADTDNERIRSTIGNYNYSIYHYIFLRYAIKIIFST